MDIASMLEREDFYTILRDTLLTYYRQVQHRDIRVEYEPFDGCETLYMYSRLSFISRGNVPPGAKEFLYGEYNVRGNLLKYLAGKLLVFLTTHAHGLGAVRKLYITKDVLGKNAFISPQNRSIRIFDYDAMTVDCIIKSGFTDKYFNNQLAFRKKFSYDFVLPLITSGDGWFRERILRGHPLARVTDETMYIAAQDAAMRDIERLSEDTETVANAGEYFSACVEEIYGKLDRAKQEKGSQYADQLKELVRRIETACRAFDGEIPLVISHGDLQSGNIWVENDGRVWVYDWETQGRRSRWYDRATLLYSTRRADGLERFMAEEQSQLIRCTVLLEEMQFYLDDMLELPAKDGVDIFDRFAKRVLCLIKGD